MKKFIFYASELVTFAGTAPYFLPTKSSHSRQSVLAFFSTVCVGAPDPRRQDEMTLKYDHKIHNAGRFMVSRFVGRSLSVMSTPDRQVVALILECFLSSHLPPKQCKI